MRNFWRSLSFNFRLKLGRLGQASQLTQGASLAALA